jgi:hypothetical protein
MLGRPLPQECRENNKEGRHYFEKVEKVLHLRRKVIARDDDEPKNEVIIGPFAVRLKTQWSQKIGQDALPLHRQGESTVPRSRRHAFCDPERVGCKLGVSVYNMIPGLFFVCDVSCIVKACQEGEFNAHTMSGCEIWRRGSGTERVVLSFYHPLDPRFDAETWWWDGAVDAQNHPWEGKCVVTVSLEALRTHRLLLGPRPIITTNSISSQCIYSIVKWDIHSGSRNKKFVRGQLLMHSEVKPYVRHRMKCRDEQFHGMPGSLQEFVSVLGAEKEEVAEVRDLPTDEWKDKTACMLCPACHEFNPLGTVLCFNMNCGAQYRFAQHRFSCVPEKFEIKGTDTVRARTKGSNREEHDQSAASSDGTSAVSEEVDVVADQVSRRVVTYVQKMATYGSSMRVSFQKQLLKNIHTIVLHITKSPDYQLWCPFGFYDRNHPCWLDAKATVHWWDQQQTPYDGFAHRSEIVYSTREVKERARSGEMVPQGELISSTQNRQMLGSLMTILCL